MLVCRDEHANSHAVTGISYTAGGTTTYVYDNNGNLTSSSGKGYTWDYRNRLTAAGATGATTTYTYDHENQRVQKKTSTATTTYVNIYFNVASTSSNATNTKHIYTPGGELLATVIGTSSAATTTYLHLDHLGGLNVATDGNQAATQVLDYYPYGSPRIATGSHDSQRRYIGEHYDPETTFSYLNARYYEGSRGQFLSQDPVFLGIGSGGQSTQSRQELTRVLADPQLMNSYSYAKGNPITLKDPTGELPIVWLAWVGANVAYNVAQYYIEQYEANTALNYPSAFSPHEFARLQAAPGKRLEEGVVGGILTDFIGKPGNPIGVAFDIATLIEDINDEFKYYFPDAVKRREDRFNGLSKQSVTITASSNGSSGYTTPSASGSSQSRPTGASVGSSVSGPRSSGSFGLTANTPITSANVSALISFISQFLK